jgi:uroporphyrinogen III methyltransferase / synthase
VVFTSVNGVERFFARLDQLERDVRDLHRARIAAIGPETARALARRHLRADVVPDEYRAEGLLAALADDVRGRRFLLPRAAGARAILPDTLRAAGADVDEVITYRSEVPDESVALLRAALDAGPLDVVTFTSSSTVTSFLALLRRAAGDEHRARIAGAKIACIGPITAATAAEHGLRVDVVPEQYTIAALVDAVVASCGGAGVAAEEVR